MIFILGTLAWEWNGEHMYTESSRQTTNDIEHTAIVCPDFGQCIIEGMAINDTYCGLESNLDNFQGKCNAVALVQNASYLSGFR